jgi:hypothetical protein
MDRSIVEWEKIPIIMLPGSGIGSHMYRNMMKRKNWFKNLI